MKMKKEYVILAVLIVLLSLYLVFHKTDKTKYQIPSVPEVVKKKISKIELTTSAESIVLTRQDGNWTIAPEGYLADGKKVNSIR